jgi:signal transduction histidine kinase
MQAREFLQPVTLLDERNTLADATPSIASNVPVFIRFQEGWRTLNPNRLIGYPKSRRVIDVPLDSVMSVSPDTEILSVIHAPWTVLPVEEHGQIVGHLNRGDLLDVLARKRGPDELTEGLLPRLMAPLLHDLANSLTIANAAIDSSENAGTPGRRAAHTALSHAVAILNRVREVCAGDSESPPSALDLNGLLNVLSPLLQIVGGRGVKVEMRLSTRVGPIHAYRRLVERTILNLVLNASEAMGGIGAIRIATQPVSEAGGTFTQLTVDDDGPGFSPGTLDLVLAPGFSSKAGSTRGVGLSGIVQALARVGARVVPADSTLGGARFEVYFLQEVAG